MAERVYNVLFLCTGNSARSVLGESLLNHWGRGKFRAHSAGSFPRGEVNPLALDLLRRLNLPTEGLRSKSWDEFAQPDAPNLDFVITVCDNAAGEVCPIWPGHPITAHWGLPDPAAVQGTEADKIAAFRETFHALEHRIKPFVELPVASLDRLKLQDHVREIGRASDTDVG
jgi:arsenate reductase